MEYDKPKDKFKIIPCWTKGINYKINKQIEVIIELNETYFVNIKIIKKTTNPIKVKIQLVIIHIPAKHATILPPLKLKKIG